ncbi:MAG: S46 family peptidase [Acidobacteriota bacterium]
MKRLSTIVLCFLAATAALADEGMWMPQQMPNLSAKLKAAGLKMDAKRFADLTGDPMGAVVSLGGCSASFVSPDGLVVTNHHCAFGALQFNSTPQRDLITNGFLAKSRDEELPAGPGSRVFVTTKIEDVTGKVTGNLADSLSNIEREKAIDRGVKQLVEECEKPGGVRCRVASFFEGAQYLRTTQMEIRDVRLVYAPAEGIGNFGGETDNWMWPRHTGDWSYLRAYVGKDGKPADFSKDNVVFHPKHILKVSSKGVNTGDLVMVAGYPGRTFRYRTSTEVGNMQEYTYPTTIKYATDLNSILREIGKNDKAIEIANANRIKGNDNTLKNYTGSLSGFEKFEIVAQRKKREAALADYIAKHPEKAAKYKSVLDDMKALSTKQLANQPRSTTLGWVVRSSPMLGQAMQLYRLSIERPKSDLDRESGYQERDWPRIAEGVSRAQKSLEAKSDRVGLKYFLGETAKLPADQRIAALDSMISKAGGIDPFLDQLYGNTKIGELDARKAMQKESTAQLEARNDAFINVAAALSPMILESEQRDKEFGGAMSRLRPMYMEALKASSGGNLYPDANGTLRVTFGKVEGYVPRDGVSYKPQTTISGIVEKHTGTGEFDAPKAQLAAIKAGKTKGYVDPQLGEVPVDFLSNVDTTGGNSGSPTLNADGELCGLLFDGTYESLGSDFAVDPEITRSIHVDAVYMLWVMDAVDGAHNLLREMGLKPKFAGEGMTAAGSK